MIAVRIFLYVTIPLLAFASLKGGNVISFDYFEVIIHVIPIGVYVGILGALIRKEINLISSKILKNSIVLFTIIWAMMFVAYIFWKDNICSDLNHCNLSSMELGITLTICLIPLIGLLLRRKSKGFVS